MLARDSDGSDIEHVDTRLRSRWISIDAERVRVWITTEGRANAMLYHLHADFGDL